MLIVTKLQSTIKITFGYEEFCFSEYLINQGINYSNIFYEIFFGYSLLLIITSNN